MLENLLQAAVPFSLLVISIIGFFIKKTLSTIEETQIKLSDRLGKVHTDFQVSKIELINIKDNFTRTATSVERQENTIMDLNKRVYNHGHDIRAAENNISGFIQLEKESSKRISEIEKDIVAIKSKAS